MVGTARSCPAAATSASSSDPATDPIAIASNAGPNPRPRPPAEVGVTMSAPAAATGSDPAAPMGSAPAAPMGMAARGAAPWPTTSGAPGRRSPAVEDGEHLACDPLARADRAVDVARPHRCGLGSGPVDGADGLGQRRPELRQPPGRQVGAVAPAGPFL